jgi:predicted enzyme related to lactoylglutathione lyase
MPIDIAFAGVPVAAYDTALPWYERLFGRPPDVVVKEDESMWQVAEKAWIYVVADADRAGNALVTLMVSDLGEHVAELEARGVAVGAIETAPGRFRRVAITDPEGNRIAFAEVLGDTADAAR